MDLLLTVGSSGNAVGELQTLLNVRMPNRLPQLVVDRRFGPHTLARVREFQTSASLKPDGVVGPRTWAKLRAGWPPMAPVVRPRTGCICGNCDPRNQGLTLSLQKKFAPAAAGGGQRSSFAVSAPSLSNHLRPLTSAQIATASGVFGTSIDFSRVSISTLTGIGGAAFTVAVPGGMLSPATQVINCGTFDPPPRLLIHELTHVWQSQHSYLSGQFMVNSVASQAAAVTANEAAAQLAPSLLVDPNFPRYFPYSCYSFRSGKAFGDYCAEQIAKAVEYSLVPPRTLTSAEKAHCDAMASHVRGVAQGAADTANMRGLALPRFEDTRAANVLN